MNFNLSPTFTKQKNLVSDLLNHFMATDDEGRRGFGTDKDLELAKRKSLFEYLERVVMSSGLLGEFTTSNGFATHTDEKKARNNAVAELLERDMFLCSWLMKQKMSRLQIELDEDSEHLSAELKREGLEMRPGIVGVCSGIICFGGWVIDLEKMSGIFVSCASASLKDGLRKLYEDGIQAASVLKYARQNKEQKLEKLVDIHTNYYLARENFESVRWHWNEFEDGILEFPEIVPEVQSIKCTMNDDFGFFCARAVSHQLQSFYVGVTTKEKLNLNRFENLGFDPAGINTQLHPLA